MSGSTRTIIRHLANGIDPLTGVALPSTAPYNHPEVIRALFSVLEELDREKAPARHGTPWSQEEKQQTIKDFKSGLPIENIATKLDRKKGAVWSMLEHLGVVQPLSYKTLKPQHLNPSSQSALTV